MSILYLFLNFLIFNTNNINYCKNNIQESMKNLTEEIGRICNILEDAVEEQDWKLVSRMIEALDDVYMTLDKEDSSFGVYDE